MCCRHLACILIFAYNLTFIAEGISSTHQPCCINRALYNEEASTYYISTKDSSAVIASAIVCITGPPTRKKSASNHRPIEFFRKLKGENNLPSSVKHGI